MTAKEYALKMKELADLEVPSMQIRRKVGDASEVLISLEVDASGLLTVFVPYLSATSFVMDLEQVEHLQDWLNATYTMRDRRPKVSE